MGEQAYLPLTVAIGLVIWMRYCDFLRMGMMYLPHSALEPAVPQASPCRCILKSSRSAASRED